MTALIGEIVDRDAIEIGRLYDAAQTSGLETANALVVCAKKLFAKKASLNHGEWLPWLEANEGTLGFGYIQAARILKLANSSLAMNMAEAAAILKIAYGKSSQAEKLQRRLDREIVPDGLPQVSDRYRLLHGDLADAEIEPGSIDCIITDPPYPEEFIDLYGTLAIQAGKWLKHGGSLLAMAGQIHLPRVLQALTSGELTYHWTVAYLVPGGQATQIFPRKVNVFWKPVFWFVKGEYTGDWVGDVTRSEVNDNDKRFHDWGQSESGFADLIGRFTRPGDVICDPFMGGGTTGIVALAMNRLFVGIERNEETFEIARKRIGGGEYGQAA